MNLNQHILYLFEQEEVFEKSICQTSENLMKEIMKPNGLNVGSKDHIRYEIFDEFSLIEAPIRTRYMHSIHLYSLFERYSIKFSRIISKNNNLLNIDDLKGGKNFTAIKIFYTKVFNIKFQNWKEIDELRIFRNAVAHTDGFVESSDNNQALNLSRSNVNITCLSNNRIICNRNFFKVSVKAVIAFFDIIYKHIDENEHDLEFDHRLRHEFLKFESTSA